MQSIVGPAQQRLFQLLNLEGFGQHSQDMDVQKQVQIGLEVQFESLSRAHAS